MNKRLTLLSFLSFYFLIQQFSQGQSFSRQDTLRGSITEYRSWWDLKYYHLKVSVNVDSQSIAGSNLIRYEVLNSGNVIQIDLQEPLYISKVVHDNENLEFSREGNVYWIHFKELQHPGNIHEIEIYYQGEPKKAKRAPWDGGFSWKKSEDGSPFIATSCQGLGASVWWPCKDHMYDEPDSMLISVKVPENLMDISNGRLVGIQENPDHTKTFHWKVNNPINNYGVNVNIGNYVHFGEKYQGEAGALDIDYYVLPENLEKAKEQFKQVPMMLKAFEHWFGPYPFYEDGFKLVEVPYLGMEHQSSITYGNGYENGYLGRDLSGTGWGLKFDFIIVHESGHEWFANSLTYKDIADMWIHESFTNYSESLYLEYHFGKEVANAYVLGTRMNIQNDRPIIGQYGVNHSGSGDMYYKGGNMLHTLRQVVNDDEKWRGILRGIQKHFYHQTVSSRDVEDFISRETGLDLRPFFDQYLRDTRVPILEYKCSKEGLVFRWSNCVDEFNMPVRIKLDGKPLELQPTTNWKEVLMDTGEGEISVDSSYYVAYLNNSGGRIIRNN